MVVEAILSDNKNRGIRLLDDVYDPIDDDEYRIAVRIGHGYYEWNEVVDYHFMREDKNGNWSHKPSTMPIQYLEEGETPDDVSWDLYIETAVGYRVAIKGFYNPETTRYFAIKYPSN